MIDPQNTSRPPVTKLWGFPITPAFLPASLPIAAALTLLLPFSIKDLGFPFCKMEALDQMLPECLPALMAHCWAYEMVLVAQGLQVSWRRQTSMHETYKAGILNPATQLNPWGAL